MFERLWSKVFCQTCVWFAVFTLTHLFPTEHTNTDTFLSVLRLFSDKRFTHLGLCQLVPDGQNTPHRCVDPGNMVNLQVQHVLLMLYCPFEPLGNLILLNWKDELNHHWIFIKKVSVSESLMRKIHLDPTRGGASHL